MSYSDAGIRSIQGLDYTLVELGTADDTQHSAIVNWLVQRAKSPQTNLMARDELGKINQWLRQHNKETWLMYDELDVLKDEQLRKRALEALFSWWLDIENSLNCIRPKIFLREDIWKQLNFTNTGHYLGRSLQLRWDEVDLWRLVLRQVLNSSSAMRELLEQRFGLTVDNLENFGVEQLRQSLFPLWGERMGRTKKAYTANWVSSRIRDSQENRFPRSLMILLQKAIELERGYLRPNTYDTILRPQALIEALPYVSEQRVQEVLNEYKELENYLHKLRGLRSPTDSGYLADAWDLKDAKKMKQVTTSMLEAGIFKERPLGTSEKMHLQFGYDTSEFDRGTSYKGNIKGLELNRYAVAELYLSGLGMIRKGQR